jgi:hypothetical protein
VNEGQINRIGQHTISRFYLYDAIKFKLKKYLNKKNAMQLKIIIRFRVFPNIEDFGKSLVGRGSREL